MITTKINSAPSILIYNDYKSHLSPGLRSIFSPRVHGDEFSAWIGENHAFRTNEETLVDFKQALVLNGLHPTTSKDDPDPTPHVMVRMSTPVLREENMWYILHWQLGGESVFLGRRPRNQEATEHNSERDGRRN